MVVVAVLVVLLLVVLLLGDHTMGGGAVDTQHETIYIYISIYLQICNNKNFKSCISSSTPSLHNSHNFVPSDVETLSKCFHQKGRGASAEVVTATLTSLQLDLSPQIVFAKKIK